MVLSDPFRFQFIGFPSEWGELKSVLLNLLGPRFQFIGFPSEWGADASQRGAANYLRFQFIGFPSEWGDSEIMIEGHKVTLKFPIYWVPQRVGSQ